MRYKAVFFDFDGTIMDTSEGIFAGGRYAMDKVGIQIPKDAKWQEFIGPPILECFRVTFGVQEQDKLKQLAEAYHEFYMAEGRYRACFYKGFPQILEQLRSRGYLLGIASMKGDDLVNEMVRHFGIAGLFDVVLGAKGKATKADLLAEGCTRLGIKTSECVLVGDTKFDALGAEGAGCAFISVDWGFGFAPGEPGAVSTTDGILERV